MRRLVPALLLAVMAYAPAAFASGGPATSGSASLGLALQMYCGAYNVLTGNLGLLLGLLIAAYGLWILISDGAFGRGVAIITAGALLTALPGLTSSFIQGVGDYLYSVGISTTGGGALRMATDIAERSSCSGINIDWNDFDADNPNYWEKGGGASFGAPDYKGVADGDYTPPSAAATGPDACIFSPPNGSCVSQRDAGRSAAAYRNIVPNAGNVTSCFGHRNLGGIAGNPNHSGMDISCGGANVPVFAGVSGVVASNPGAGSGSTGYAVWINSGEGNYMFAHLVRGSSSLRKGDTVTANDVIGTCGNSGTTQVHLHVEFWPSTGAPCRRIDPFGKLPTGGPPTPKSGP